MDRLWIVMGSISGFVSVAAGAFGAHVLRQKLEPDLLAVFETAARYQMYHALALVGVGLLCLRGQSAACTAAGAGFAAGTVLFSGSLYLLALTGTRWLGAITPLGGVAFLAGWVALAIAALRSAG